MNGSANAFTPDANMLAALTGRGNPQLIALAAANYNIAGITTINPADGLFQQITTGAGNTTLNTTDVGKPGQELILEIANDAGGARTITFGANFRPTAATIVGTASKSMLIAFRSNGVKWMEEYRTIAIT